MEQATDLTSKPNNQDLPPALCLMGPTAAGKTRLAFRLAEQHPFEIINVDSVQVYRGLDVGTGKPDRETLRKFPHRLVDILDPAEPYSAADFREDALREMRAAQQAGKTPLLVGGTMLYFKVLRDGLASMPPADETVRRAISELAESKGWSAVHKRLEEVDPASARRIHPNDPQRLQRALEVYEVTGKSLSEFHEDEKRSSAEVKPLPFDLRFVALYPEDRSVLHRFIEARFHQMLADGFVEEVKALRAREDLNLDLPSMRAVGYRQIWEYLSGIYDYDTMVDKAVAATRQLAKRQLTWLRSWPDLEVRHTDDPDNVNLCLKRLRIAHN